MNRPDYYTDVESDLQLIFDIETSIGILWFEGVSLYSVRDYFRHMWN